MTTTQIARIAEEHDYTVTEENIDAVRESVSANDQREEINVGDRITHYRLMYSGGQRGDLTIWHRVDRAAIATGGTSLWGDWSDRYRNIQGDGFTYAVSASEVTEQTE